MQKHVTKAALALLTQEFSNADTEMKNAKTVEKHEYFLGKKNGLIEAFAALCGLDWIRAEIKLRAMVEALEKTKN